MIANKKWFLSMIVLGCISFQGELIGNVIPDPESNFDVTIEITKTEFLVGEPVVLELQAANLSNTAVGVLDLRGRYFQITGTDSEGQPLVGRTDAWGPGLNPVRKVAPGDIFSDVVYLNYYLVFPGPGEYTVTYEGTLLIHEENEKDEIQQMEGISISGKVKVILREGTPVEIEIRLQQYVKQLTNKDSRLRYQAVRAFAYANPEIATKLLIETIESKDAQYIPYLKEVIRALGNVKSARSVKVLLELAKGSDNLMLRKEAIHAAGCSLYAGEESILSVFTQLLSDQDADIRIAALRGIKSVGNKSCIPQVELLLDDPDEQVREEAAKTLQKLIREN